MHDPVRGSSLTSRTSPSGGAAGLGATKPRAGATRVLEAIAVGLGGRWRVLVPARLRTP